MAVDPNVSVKIQRSEMLSEYEIAFLKASGLAMRFEPVREENGVPGQPAGNQGAGNPFLGHPEGNPFCTLVSQTPSGCRMCVQMEQKLLDPTGEETRTASCLAGLTDTAVPVTVHGRLAGYLRTGQIALQKINRKQFTRLARTLVDWGLHTDLRQMEEAWFHSKVLDPGQYEAFVGLLKVFAKHLGLAAEQLGPEALDSDAPWLRKAKAYIALHQQEEVRVQDVAKVLNLSVYYFCKVFKKATGRTFTQYLCEVRVAKAKNLLQNPHLRVSEVAYEAGFQSITHFNRIFRKEVGQSPSAYRAGIQRMLEAQSSGDRGADKEG